MSKRPCQRVSYTIHSENSYASGHKKRPRGPRGALSSAGPHDTESAMQNAIAVDLETQAISFFIHYHVKTYDDPLEISRTVSDSIINISRREANRSPTVDLALSTVALAVFSRAKKCTEAAKRAALNYHQLINKTRASIGSVEEENIDTFLLAIFSMARYEDALFDTDQLSFGKSFTSNLRSCSHHDGSLAVLSAWVRIRGRDTPATSVIKHTRRGLIRSFLLRSLALPISLHEGKLFGEHGLEVEYDAVLIRVLNIRRRLSILRLPEKGQVCTTGELSSLAYWIDDEAQDIDLALHNWTEHFPDTWSYQKHTLPLSKLWAKRYHSIELVYSYANPAQAATWCQYYAMRLLINSTRLRNFELLGTYMDNLASEKWRLECASCMNHLSKELISSIPYCLQEFDGIIHPTPDSLETNTPSKTEDLKPHLANLVIWPLTIAAGIDNLGLNYKAWFRSELARIGKLTGYGVLECAESDQ